MVVGPGNGAAQIWVVVVVFAGFRLQCRPRVRQGFGDFSFSIKTVERSSPTGQVMFEYVLLDGTIFQSIVIWWLSCFFHSFFLPLVIRAV
jgi:hypothetical protein